MYVVHKLVRVLKLLRQGQLKICPESVKIRRTFSAEQSQNFAIMIYFVALADWLVSSNQDFCAYFLEYFVCNGFTE